MQLLLGLRDHSVDHPRAANSYMSALGNLFKASTTLVKFKMRFSYPHNLPVKCCIELPLEKTSRYCKSSHKNPHNQTARKRYKDLFNILGNVILYVITDMSNVKCQKTTGQLIVYQQLFIARYVDKKTQANQNLTKPTLRLSNALIMHAVTTILR